MNTKAQIVNASKIAILVCGFISIPAFAAAPDASPTGTYTFNGKAKLSKSGLPFSPTCKLSLTGDVVNATQGGKEGVLITVTGGSVTKGDSLCGSISVGGFPWTAFKQDGDIQQDLNQNALGPVKLVSNSSPSGTDASVQGVTVEINIPFVSDCDGDVEANFLNGQSAISDTSYFTFDDSFDGCSIQTTEPLKVDSNASDNDDVNVQ